MAKMNIPMRAALAALMLGGALPAATIGAAPAAAQTATPALSIPIDSYTLPNGLKVVLVPNTKTGMVTVKTFYGIGFRVEPGDRTGFAHLFEHLMFQGSKNAPKGVFDSEVTGAGGYNNGSTRFDYTDYIEVVPSHALERMLWLDADRLANPVIDETVLKNQQGVVGNEVKVNVLNRPYGSWPWVDLPMLANTNWYNAHNFYGDLKEIEAATVADAKDFSRKYYVPNNAVLVVQGDFDVARTKAAIKRYFGPIKRGPAVKLPDLSEPVQTKAKWAQRTDRLAPKPGYSFGYRLPPRGGEDWIAFGLIDQMLLQGFDSRLAKALQVDTPVTGDLGGGMNGFLGDMYSYNGPSLWMASLTHDSAVSGVAIDRMVSKVIDDFVANGPSDAELARAKVKIKSDLYGSIANNGGGGLADLVGLSALFGEDPRMVNRLPDRFDAVTRDDVMRVARTYLKPEQRSTMLIVPEAPKGAAQ